MNFPPQLHEPDSQNIPELWADFLSCIPSAKRPVCDIETGYRSTAMSLLGMLSLKLGRSVQWDVQATQSPTIWKRASCYGALAVNRGSTPKRERRAPGAGTAMLSCKIASPRPVTQAVRLHAKREKKNWQEYLFGKKMNA